MPAVQQQRSLTKVVMSLKSGEKAPQYDLNAMAQSAKDLDITLMLWQTHITAGAASVGLVLHLSVLHLPVNLLGTAQLLQALEWSSAALQQHYQHTVYSAQTLIAASQSPTGSAGAACLQLQSARQQRMHIALRKPCYQQPTSAPQAH
jgi:hypothetical protein